MSRKRGAKDVNDSIKTKRVKRVLELMGRGLYMFEIVDILMKEWDCSRRNVYKYIEKSKEILKNSISQSDKDEFINQFDQLLQKAYEIKDYKLANAILANKGRFTIGEKVDVKHNIYQSKFPNLDEDNQPDKTT